MDNDKQVIDRLLTQLDVAVKTIASALSFRLRATRVIPEKGDLIIISRDPDLETSDLADRVLADASKDLADLLRWHGCMGVVVIPCIKGLTIDALEPAILEAHGWVRKPQDP